MKPKQKKWLLGVGLDEVEGHKRLTKGDNFYLVGGSKDTHAQMIEKAIKMNESLKKIDKDLNTVTRKEFEDISHKLGLHPIKSKKDAIH